VKEDLERKTRKLLMGVGLVLFMLAVPLASSSQQRTGSGATTQTTVSTAPVVLGLIDARASYGIPGYDTVKVQQADLKMIYSANPSCVRIDIGYAPWLSNSQGAISLVDGVVSSVRSSGKCLIIADAASESYRSGGQIPWSEFKVAWVQRVQTLAARYKPDYYIVVKEPGWYAPMISDIATNSLTQNPGEWIQLTQALASSVMSVSPTTRVGIAVAADSLRSKPSLYVPYLNGCSQLTSLSFIGFDIYTATGQTATQNFLALNGVGSKAVWIAEAWSSEPPSGTPQGDAQWMSSIYQYAVQIHARVLIPFYSDLFADYTLSSQTNATSIVSLYNNRTPVFHAFQSLPRL
jgi:hypothetical protein